VGFDSEVGARFAKPNPYRAGFSSEAISKAFCGNAAGSGLSCLSIHLYCPVIVDGNTN